MASFSSFNDDIIPPTDLLPVVSATDAPNASNGFDAVKRDPESWSGALPANQGLYLNENEKDACGVGFICHIKGNPSHKIVSDARQLLCAMTHRGATGADSQRRRRCRCHDGHSSSIFQARG
jgi:glutamate synthase (NADPH/NADH)